MLLLCAAALCILCLLFSSRAETPAMKTSNARTSSPVTGSFAPSLSRTSHAEVTDAEVVHHVDPKADQRGEQDAAAQRTLAAAAGGAVEYVELQCDGGEPEVDLSYWKDISQDK